MVRFVAYLVIALLVITLVRALMGWIARALQQLLEPATAQRSAPSYRGELKQDPVCGVYVSTETPFRKRVGDHEWYFCSAQCRDRYGR